MPPPRLSVLIPARGEAGRLPLLLADLAAAPLPIAEVVVVDGGSCDGTPRLAALAGARVLASPPGRGRQLVFGASRVDGDWLLVLHADARLRPGWDRSVARAMASSGLQAWCFPLTVARDLPAGLGPGPCLALLGWLVGLRTRVLQCPYGDQGLLLPMALYRQVGGYRALPLMEDLDLVRRLAPVTRIRLLAPALRSDGRRWLALGLWRTTSINAGLRRAWRRGVRPEVLARYYRAPLGFRRRTRRRSGAPGVPAPSPDGDRTPPRPGRRRG